MKKVTDKEWREKANNLTKWREKRTSPPNLDLYKKIVSMVHVGYFVLDCGQRHLHTVLKDSDYTGDYFGIDPFPIVEPTQKLSAEELLNFEGKQFDSAFMLSALDNVKNVSKSLQGLKHVTKENIIILTSIGVPKDENHTHQIDRKDLTDVLGEPTLEVELSPKLFLFEFTL